jgi:hypothetical protein
MKSRWNNISMKRTQGDLCDWMKAMVWWAIQVCYSLILLPGVLFMYLNIWGRFMGLQISFWGKIRIHWEEFNYVPLTQMVWLVAEFESQKPLSKRNMKKEGKRKTELPVSTLTHWKLLIIYHITSASYSRRS